MAETTATTSLASPPDGELSGTSLPSSSAAASSIEVKKRGGVVSSSPPDDPIVDSQIAFDTPKSNPGLGGSSVAGKRSLSSRSVDSYNRGGGGNTNKEKGRDPPEIEWPTNKNSDETTHDKKSPTKSTTSFYVPNPRRNPTLSKSSSSSFHGRNNSSNGSTSSSFNSSMSSIHQRARGISGEGGGRDTPDVLSTSYKTKSSLSGDALNLSYRSKSSSSDEDHVVFMDPIESDEEPEQKEGSDSDEEATLTDHPDEDEASPRLRSRPTFPIVLMKNNYPQTAPAPLRNDSHIQQGRSSKDQQHLSNWKCPTSAPQHRLSNQQAMHFLNTGGHSSTGRISRSFGGGNPGPGPASGEGIGGVIPLPLYHLSGRQNSNNLKPSQRIQSLPRRNTIQSQSQQQHYQKHVPSSRRVSEAAIQYLYTDGIDLLKKAAIEANAPEEVESLNDKINFLRSSLESTVLEEGGYQEEECVMSIPSLQPKFDVTPNEQHFNQSSASVSLPPSRPSPAENHRVKRRNSHGSSKAIGSHTIHQQQQVGYPTSQTRCPPITAAAGMEYIMNASRAHTQSDNSDTSNEHDNDDDDEIVDVSSKNHDILDVGKMQYFLNAITRGVDSKEGAKNDTHPSSRGKNTRRTSLEDYDDHIDRKLSMHAEVKNDITPGHHSKSLPHVRSRHLIERECSSSAPSVSSVIPPSSDHNFAAEAEDSFNDDVCDRQISSRALGPRSQRPGGTTGIVLESSGSLSSSDGDHTTRSKFNRQISDPIVMSPDGESRGWSEKSLGGDFIDAESTLMMKLCSHLLPAVLDNDHMIDNSLSDQLVLNKINLVWDNDDPDEPGYIVHRLTESELASIEIAFEKYVALSAQMSEKHMSNMSNDSNFERDLEEVEGILSKLSMPKKKASESTNIDDSDLQVTSSQENGAIRDSAPNFPGIYPSGKGIAGELECFYLPIITKSQNTGFEPTKDIVLKPGSIFAKNYLVQSELGSAAFSTAYQCLDLSSEEDEDGYRDEVCLKVIKNTKDYFDQSLDEIKILQLLKDTGKTEENHVVKMKSFFYHREHLVIVTELLRQNLYEFGKIIIESRGNVYFTRPRLSHIIRQCLVALKFVHELGLVHSDIKPENILLSSYSRALIKIIDFGSSSFVSDRQSSYIQSRSYRAPEVILGLPYDGKIDIWSLGCVVAELYTNEVTFQNDSELSMLSRLEAICGPFPRHMIDKGRNCHRIFTDSGLIYKKISSSDDDDVDKDSSHGSSSIDNSEKFFFRVYQPKTTTVAARLGFDEDLLDQPHLSDNDKNRALFTDFVRKLLMIDPDKRPTAAEALDHPWIKSSLDLTEEDILYYQGN